MADIQYMGLPVAGSIPIDDTDINIHKVWSSQRVDGGMEYSLGLATLTNGVVVFDDLNPNFKYGLDWETVGANGVDAVGTLNPPYIKNVIKAAGTHSTTENPTIKLTYEIGNGTNDVSRFALKYNKGALGSFTSTQEGYAPVIVVNDLQIYDHTATVTVPADNSYSSVIPYSDFGSDVTYSKIVGSFLTYWSANGMLALQTHQNGVYVYAAKAFTNGNVGIRLVVKK